MTKSKANPKSRARAPHPSPNPALGQRRTRPIEQRAIDKAAATRSRILDWSDVADELPDIPETLARYRQAQAAKSEAEAILDQLKPELSAAFLLAGDDVKTIDAGKHKMTWVRTPRKTIVAELLLAAGVSMTTIEKCTKVTWSEYPLVTDSNDAELPL